MSTLDEIEAAAQALPFEDKEKLLVFLASELRAVRGKLPDPRKFSREEVEKWIEQDEADMNRPQGEKVKLFLDASMLLAACGSERGASREIFRIAQSHQWRLIATPYVTSEVEANLHHLPIEAEKSWQQLRAELEISRDVFTVDRIAIFEPAKDRPILFSALAWADVLLTLDQQDFGKLMGGQFYGLHIMRPGQFLAVARNA